MLFLRFETLLTNDEQALVRDYQRRVIADLQESWAAFVKDEAPGYPKAIDADTWSRNPWLLYATEPHVERWADFFAPRLPRMPPRPKQALTEAFPRT